MDKGFVDFVDLAFYWTGETCSLFLREKTEILFRAVEDLQKDPIFFWEILDKSLERGWGVQRTAEFLMNNGFPKYLVQEFLVSRKIGIGYSARYFFNNFYRKVRAILRFVSKYRDFNRQKFEGALSELALASELRDVAGMVWWAVQEKFYYFETKYCDYIVIFETYDFKNVRVHFESFERERRIEFEIKCEQAKKKIIETLKNNIINRKIDKDSLERQVKTMNDSEKFRFKHIVREIENLINS